MKHFCRSEVPFLKQLGGGVGPGGERQGVPFEAETPSEAILSTSVCTTLTKGHTLIHVVCDDSPPLPPPPRLSNTV
ncbi:hypothetical protein PBY51_024858 [Eleginops maclovinus]|uniref:Uncharacterized protein n=1 Tax=Eleginops maclovinus TaxID=56733 RepID=A0AAN7Y074_ELEMC|nr:hypothetical protein PBY51_024858 [Eleginops maclovinus]